MGNDFLNEHIKTIDVSVKPKESFYRNENEKLLKQAIDCLYNDYVGGEENHYLDNDERYFNFDEKRLVEIITDDLLKEKQCLWLENGFAIEAKHIRFIGKERVKEIVSHRVNYRHKKEGWCFENCKKVFGGKL